MRFAVGTAVAALALMLAPAAMAQNSSAETYAGQGGEVALVGNSDDPGSGTASVAADSSSTLPFTGLDVSLLAGGGLVLLLGGLAMARLTASRRDTL